MKPDLRKAAQKRADRIASFREELAEITREGGLALTAEQQSGLDAHLTTLIGQLQQQYGVDATESARRVSWGMRIVTVLGAAALLAAGILFLHRIWGYLSTVQQVVVLTTAPLALLLATEIAHRRRVGLFYVSLFALASGTAFVMELSTLGVVLNLTDSPMVLLAWGGFALLIAYAYGLRLLLAAGLILLCAWTGATVLHLQGFSWNEFMQRTQLLIPGAVLLYAIPWLTRGRGPEGFGAVYRLCGAGLLFLSLLLLSTTGDLCCGGLAPETLAGAYQLLGLAAAGGVLYHGLRLGETALVNSGALAFVIFLFARLHSWWWDWMPKYLFCFLLGLIAFGLLLVFRRIRTQISKGGEL